MSYSVTKQQALAQQFLIRKATSIPIVIKHNLSADQYKTPHSHFDWTIKISRDKLSAEQFLIENYDLMSNSQIANMLGCHRNVVIRKAKKLKLVRNRTQQKHGTPFDDNDKRLLIRMLKQNIPNGCIAKRLSRTKGSVRKKITRLINTHELSLEIGDSRICQHKTCTDCINSAQSCK